MVYFGVKHWQLGCHNIWPLLALSLFRHRPLHSYYGYHIVLNQNSGTKQDVLRKTLQIPFSILKDCFGGFKKQRFHSNPEFDRDALRKQTKKQTLIMAALLEGTTIVTT